MKKRTKQELGDFCARLVHAKRTGEKFKKPRKDGGITTRPFLEFNPLPESDVLKQCVKFLGKLGYGAKRLNNGSFDTGSGYRSYGVRGAGDLLVIKKGRFIEVECKKGKGGVLSANQQKHRAWVEAYGGKYVVVHDVSELQYYIEHGEI